MAVTQLTNVIIPEIYEQIMLKESTYKSALFRTGAMAENADITARASANYGQILHLPFYNDLDQGESNVSTDDPTDVAVAANLTEVDQRAVKNQRNKGWGSANLVTALNSKDPTAIAAGRAGTYWANQIDQGGIAMLEGIRADNAANDSSDMIYNAYNDVVVGSLTGANLMSAENIIRAKDTAGDAADDMNIIVMHSRAYHRLQVLNLIDFIPDSQGVVNMPTYMGMNVVVSDACKVVAGTNTPQYWSYIMQAGTIMFGDGSPHTPVAINREEAQGNGEGVDELWTRRHWIAHVDGVDCTFDPTGGVTPSWADLESATSWDRAVSDRKQIPLAFLGTNGEI